ncbi:MAG: DUF2442 domain-containing protein [Candidatus Lambdaproteobacteria bacterium]|nr:DUF2442 domain-containing protein [Candidatus Lambdaproteobacteria bacterium]
MQRPQDPKTDRSAEIAPAIRHTVPWRVVAVEALSERRLRVRFVDGTTGLVELGPFLAAPSVTGTVFEPLRDPDAFNAVQVVLGAVQWPNGADLAPDAMYDAIRQHGRWAPEAP